MFRDTPSLVVGLAETIHDVLLFFYFCFQSEQEQRPTAEDTLLWLEDLTDSLPEDLEEPRSPIDYESLFPLEVGERESPGAGGNERGGDSRSRLGGIWSINLWAKKDRKLPRGPCAPRGSCAELKRVKWIVQFVSQPIAPVTSWENVL